MGIKGFEWLRKSDWKYARVISILKEEIKLCKKNLDDLEYNDSNRTLIAHLIAKHDTLNDILHRVKHL